MFTDREGKSNRGSNFYLIRLWILRSGIILHDLRVNFGRVWILDNLAHCLIIHFTSNNSFKKELHA